MKKYLNNLIKEKGIDINTIFEIEGKTGVNLITLEVVIEHILIAAKKDQQAIKKTLVEIDFVNADVLDFFKHLAKSIAL
ncbi:hypothetical protein MS2017_1342 [Bathymodiolus thermophilus thioautotrophic gill symbiont]|uniref:Uncharacterized protein n=1 Tax=Bathymodiolus thermophilus thioautotrophic gill symbiont TaxID=2360 RepID=A0A3G3INI4_9GAMM|nr:hypothetical protein [Bathymodiolus thermophilus thioautotrophic gill symbiont]AYQ57032.1 hypothetical protein MS2017_1342 [Bathymodiolus thermophilus thioautotrophic gill symbiont]